MEKCDNIRRCLITNQIFKGNSQLIDIYRKLYCEAGEAKIESCKRYQVTKLIGYCPSHVLPNTVFSIDNIVVQAQRKNESKEIKYV